MVILAVEAGAVQDHSHVVAVLDSEIQQLIDVMMMAEPTESFEEVLDFELKVEGQMPVGELSFVVVAVVLDGYYYRLNPLAFLRIFFLVLCSMY